MFKTILIANRGEIAVRIMRTAQAMGVRCAIVYSDADAGSMAVEMADEAVRIGPAPASESYLDAKAVIAAAKQVGAEAIHPGFGFLSENAGFARALAKAKIVFIGPNPKAIEAMGDKIESKKAAARAGVNVVPGHMGVIKDASEAARIAAEIGFPVMIKASAGGGGKGMRVAGTLAEVEEGFTAAANEAASSFGDDRIFIEKFIEQPRHIEIQVLGDKHGAVVHLGERECSIQRRNQKVVEEAPSPFLDEATREAMGAQAVALSQAVDYDSAGTVEFIVDKDRNFYFLEMNTRLQVEHPVTECVTGLDLVEQMLRVAAGEKLKLRQADVTLKGWAVETRLYAEDPYRGFVPSIGRLRRFSTPPAGPWGPGVARIDTGVRAGDEISMFYDPMIAKLITSGATRADAVEAMSQVLDHVDIDGIQHNAVFLGALMAHPRFRAGELTTRFIAEEFPDGFAGDVTSDVGWRRINCVAALAAARSAARARGPLSAEGEAFALLHGRSLTQAHVALTDDGARIALDDAPAVTLTTDWELGERAFTGALDGDAFHAVVRSDGADAWRVVHAGANVRLVACPPRVGALLNTLPEHEDAHGAKQVLSPMPGLVVSVAVEPGAEVKAGQTLLVVEAMKMENAIRADRDGAIARIAVEPGASVAADDLLVEFA